MSNAKDPEQDELKDALMGRTQETEHVQSRFSNLQAPGAAPAQPGGPGTAPAASPGAQPTGTPVSTGTVSVHQPMRDKVGTFLPSAEGGPWKVAAALRLGAAGFGLMTAVLLVMPELSGKFQATSSMVSSDPIPQPTYKTLAPALDTPAPSEDPEKVITEQSTAFDGAAILMVESEPGGVSVRVDGNDQGNTPVSLTLDCLPGKPIKVEVARKGYERAQHLTFCRPDTMIKLYARLRKAGKTQ